MIQQTINASLAIAVLLACAFFCSAQDIGEISTFLTERSNQPQQTQNVTTTKSVFASYTGPQLPQDWSVLSVLNDRAIIGFKNGTSRNAAISELDPNSRAVVEKLQNGSLGGPALKEKLSQWGSTVTNKVSQFGETLRKQFDNVFSSTNATTAAPTIN